MTRRWNVLGPAGKHVLVGALSDNVVLRVLTAKQLASKVHQARSHNGKVFAVEVLVVNDLSAGRSLID